MHHRVMVPHQLRVIGAVEPAALTRMTAATRFATLEDLLRAGFEILDVIVQDEYTHDVIATRGPPASDVVWACFDTT